jgi:hypothetical protein
MPISSAAAAVDASMLTTIDMLAAASSPWYCSTAVHKKYWLCVHVLCKLMQQYAINDKLVLHDRDSINEALETHLHSSYKIERHCKVAQYSQSSAQAVVATMYAYSTSTAAVER